LTDSPYYFVEFLIDLDDFSQPRPSKRRFNPFIDEMAEVDDDDEEEEDDEEYGKEGIACALQDHMCLYLLYLQFHSIFVNP
jgi:hypothetical protein